MGFILGNSESQTGWSPIKDLSIEGKEVSSIQYCTNSGLVEVWRKDTQLYVLDKDDTLRCPPWAIYADIITLGGGGGGSGGSDANADGNGGSPGAWRSTVWAMIPGRILSVKVGTGGAGGAGGKAASGSPGTLSQVTLDDRDWVVSSEGGAGGTGTGGSPGKSPGGFAFINYGDRMDLVGGAEQSNTSTDGNGPGGGGGPGKGALLYGSKAGGNGAPGRVWVRFRSG